MKKQHTRKVSWSVTAILVLAAVCLWYGMRFHPWTDDRIINYDVVDYYEWLPAAFIYEDVYFDFVKDLPADFEGKIWVYPTPLGKQIPKMSMGLSLLWIPFFACAHLYAIFSGGAADGYSLPYAFSLFAAALFYLFWGLILLRKILKKYLPDGIVGLVLLVLVLSTNLIYYVLFEPGMSHVYSFFLFAAFLYLNDGWVETFSWKDSVILGLVTGLIVLVRPSNLVILVLPLFWKVGSVPQFRIRIKALFRNLPAVLLVGISALMVWMPQMIYWKETTGHFLYYSYGDERFYFLKPHVFKGLFGWRKGWFIYTPVMILIFPGFYCLFRKKKELFFPLFLFLILDIYIIFSWWCWWYGGSYGCRPMIEAMALLSFPLGYFFKEVAARSRLLRMACLLFLCFFTALNHFQIRQYRIALLHWDSMSYPAYRAIFGTQKWPGNMKELIVPPDYDAARKGNPER